MFLRNRITGEVHDVPDHLVHGFHTAQEVNGFGEPLGLPFLAALAPMLSNLLPAVLPAIGGLFKGPEPAPAVTPPPPPPVTVSPPPPPPAAPEPAAPPPRRVVVDREEEEVQVTRRTGPPPYDADASPPPPPGVYRVKRRVRRRKHHAALNGYGWWY